MPVTLSAWQKFIYIPDQLDLVFELPPGKKYSQIPFQPIQHFQSNIGLKVYLNKNNVGVVFKPVLSQVKQTENKSVNNQSDTKVVNSKPSLSPNRKSLIGYLGAKVVLQLRNGKSVIGYIESVGWDRLEISQRKFKGKSQLPFNYNKIQSIKLLRMN
ncbi:MAG: hypothetical protein Q9M92_01890 [Enterobacterales bacterium]|nr:hypothetical protein [Enterobacterales bacterium]